MFCNALLRNFCVFFGFWIFLDLGSTGKRVMDFLLKLNGVGYFMYYTCTWIYKAFSFGGKLHRVYRGCLCASV